QAVSLQWATLRSSFVKSKYAISPSPSLPMVIDENVPTSPAVSMADTVNGCADDEAPQLSVPLALIESTPAPAAQFPVIRVCTCDESIIAAVMLPGATAIVPDPVIGPPVRPAPVFTLVT